MPINTSPTDFLPTTPEELDRLGWKGLDVILISGDTYVDAPHIGVAVIGRVLLKAGYRVGIIAQPDVHSAQDIARLGEPDLFWGVTAGCVDSMIANFTPSGKRRKEDDMTPGGINDQRPDRATLVYSHLIRRHFKQTRPIVLGGIEASLRRISHYDGWSDNVRRSILFDAKADFLLYGMADETILALAGKLKNGEDVRALRGLCYISKELPPPEPCFKGEDIHLASHQKVSEDKAAFSQMFKQFYANAEPSSAKRLIQQQDTRYLVHNPPALPPTPEVLDAVYELPYTRSVHPYYAKKGRVEALTTIQFSLTTHRGCFGECRFCAISVHQGRRITSRSQASIVREARMMVKHPDFKGIISDVGGPTANMYAMGCRIQKQGGMCKNKNCLYPGPCKNLIVDHGPQIRLLKALRAVKGIRRIFVASGLRYDLILKDRNSGHIYLQEVLRYHTSGQLKVAPEHMAEQVLNLMGKPDQGHLDEFVHLFHNINGRLRKKQYLTYYFMAAHPGCTLADMQSLRAYVTQKLRLVPKQVQIFTPSPSTLSTLMYYTEKDPTTEGAIFVEKSLGQKIKQKEILTAPLEKRPQPKRKKRRS